MMVRRWLKVMVFYYPGHLAATLLVITTPVLLWNWQAERTLGSWEIQPWGVMPQSARLNELLSSDPVTVLGIASILLVALLIVSSLAH